MFEGNREQRGGLGATRKGRCNHGNARPLQTSRVTGKAAEMCPGVCLGLDKKHAQNIQTAAHRPGVLVGVRSEHLHGHEYGLLGTDVRGEIFVFEFFHSFHFTEMNLEKSHLVSASSGLPRASQCLLAPPGDKLTLTTQTKQSKTSEKVSVTISDPK